MNELHKTLFKIWITFVSIGLILALLLGSLVRFLPLYELIVAGVLTWSVYALIYIGVKRKSIRQKANEREFVRNDTMEATFMRTRTGLNLDEVDKLDKSPRKRYKKEHPKEYRELIKKGKKDYVNFVRTELKMRNEQAKDDKQKRKAYLEDLAKNTKKLSDVVDITNSGEDKASFSALFHYVKGAYTKDEQEYLERSLHAISYTDEMIRSGRLRPSQVKAIMKWRPKEYKKFAKYYRKKFKKEPPTYEQIYGVRKL